MRKTNTFNKIFIFIFLVAFIFLSSYFLKDKLIKIFSVKENSQDQNIVITNLQNENYKLKQEIEELNSRQEFNSQGVIDFVKANSIFFDKYNLVYSNIILNKGKAYGVSQGDLVFVAGVYPVGVITKVSENSSVLELWTNYKKVTNVIYKNTNSNINLELIGDGSYGFTAKVSKDMIININQELYLQNYPSLSVGKIIDIKESKTDNEKTLYIKSNFDRSKDFVFFIQK